MKATKQMLNEPTAAVKIEFWSTQATMSTIRERRERAELQALLRDIWQTDPESSLSEWCGLVEQALRKLASVCCGDDVEEPEPEETDADRDIGREPDDGEEVREENRRMGQ